MSQQQFDIHLLSNRLLSSLLARNFFLLKLLQFSSAVFAVVAHPSPLSESGTAKRHLLPPANVTGGTPSAQYYNFCKNLS